MSPIDFNPNNKSVNLQSQRTGNQNTAGKQDNNGAVSGEVVASKPAVEDSYLPSDALKSLNLQHTNEATESAHQERLETLKSQVTAGEYPMQSNDDAVVLDKSRSTASRMIAIESQITSKLDA